MCKSIFVLLSLVSAALAQTTGTATLVGTVTDNTGAVVPGATVTVVNIETQFVYNGQTSPEGSYYVPNINPGTYRLTLEAQGFKRYVREGVTLRTSEQPRIDVQLEVGTVTESINVTGAAPLLETETTSTGQILEGDTIVKIPVLQKYAFRVLLYLPSTSNINGTHVVGQRDRALGYTMDGISGKEPVRSPVTATNQITSTTIDALQEVKLFTTGMPAEFGHSAGGLLSTVFKSGTNLWHGSAEDRYIQKALIHRNKVEQLPRNNPFTYHELSATMSGPIYFPKLYNGKDKTFWLFGFQRHHEKASETFTGAVPSPEMLAGNFNFGGLNPIFDPATTAFGPNSGCPAGQAECWYRLPFPNNQIPANRFDPAVRNYLGRNPFTPENNTQRAINAASGPTHNLIAPTQYRSYRTRFDGKVDHQFSANHKIFGRYSHVRHRSWRDRYSPEIAWREIDYRAVPIPIDQRNVVISDTYTISPTMINEARLGYNRRRGTVFPSTIGQDWAGQLGIPNVGPETFPHFQACNNQSSCTSGTVALRQETGLSASQEVGEDFTFQENLTKIVNKHTLKFGYETIRSRYNSLVAALPSGTYRFGATDFPFRPNTGNSFAAFLLGSVSNAEFTQAVTTWLPRWWSHAFYVQDDYKVSRTITLNLGLRWSYESPFNTKYGFQSQFDPNAIDPISGRRGAITHPKEALASKDLNNFQPRLGLAWQIKPNLVFRSSFGLITQDLMANGLNQNFEEYFATASVQAPPGDPRPVFQLSQGPPALRFNVLPDGSVPFSGNNFANRSASWYDPNMRMPYIMNWSGGFQWNFTQNFLLETTYQGSRGVRLLNAWDINQVPLDISTDRAYLQTTVFPAVQNFKPYPHFGTIRHYSNYGDNSYHGVTLRTEKRYSAGLVLNAFYTFSKSLNNGDDDGNASGITFYNRALEKGRANYDIRHRFVSVMTYELPFGKGRKFMNRGGFLNTLLGGWDLAYTQTFQSGPPFTVSFAGSPNNYLPGNLRPNLVPGVDPVTPDWNIGEHRFPTQAQIPYLNAAAFEYPAAFTAGNMGRNILEAPGITWPQFSLSKEWSFLERARFILRWDMNNPFKSPNYAGPDSTFNRQNLANFGRIGTGTRGGFSDIGTASPNHLLVFRLEW
jgi:hypothetical protein